ncbi:MAG: hypothetical protein AAGJ31_15490, partial [Verrucomicrobiota bacterium]
EVKLRTDQRRSIIWLSPEEASLFPAPLGQEHLLGPISPSAVSIPAEKTHVAIANFRHQEDHWIALIPITPVQAILAQQEIFLRSPTFKRPLAAHGQLRFLLPEGCPIHLVPQRPDQAPLEISHLDDFIVSAEAVPPLIPDFPDYSLLGGTKGWFRQSVRFISTSDKVAEMEETGHEINQYLLALSPEETSQVLLESIRRSDEVGVHTTYNTLAIGGTQCVYEMFNILDRAVLDSRTETGWDRKLSKKFDRLPLYVGRYLKSRGLRYSEGTDHEMPSLNDEIASSEEKHRLMERIAKITSPHD